MLSLAPSRVGATSIETGLNGMLPGSSEWWRKSLMNWGHDPMKDGRQRG